MREKPNPQTYTIANPDLRRGEFYILTIKDNHEVGEPLGEQDVEVLFNGEGSRAGDLMGVGIMKHHIEAGYDIGIMMHPDDICEPDEKNA